MVSYWLSTYYPSKKCFENDLNKIVAHEVVFAVCGVDAVMYIRDIREIFICHYSYSHRSCYKRSLRYHEHM